MMLDFLLGSNPHFQVHGYLFVKLSSYGGCHCLSEWFSHYNLLHITDVIHVILNLLSPEVCHRATSFICVCSLHRALYPLWWLHLVYTHVPQVSLLHDLRTYNNGLTVRSSVLPQCPLSPLYPGYPYCLEINKFPTISQFFRSSSPTTSQPKLHGSHGFAEAKLPTFPDVFENVWIISLSFSWPRYFCEDS